jgi:hypothetical protein
MSAAAAAAGADDGKGVQKKVLMLYVSDAKVDCCCWCCCWC